MFCYIGNEVYREAARKALDKRSDPITETATVLDMINFDLNNSNFQFNGNYYQKANKTAIWYLNWGETILARTWENGKKFF